MADTNVDLTILQPNHFTIQKILTDSDTCSNSRVLLPLESVRNFVFPLWGDNRSAMAENGEAFTVDVWDYNTQSEHKVTFKSFGIRSFGFGGQWYTGFVKRRGLRTGNRIGLFWDTCNSRFGFCVL